MSAALTIRRTTLPAALAILALAAPGAAQETAARRPDVHFVPTPPEVVNAMLKVARVDKGDVVYDLGSGDGRIVITAAKRYGTRGIGIDIDPERIEEARHNADTAGVRMRVDFRQADLFETDLRPATVVTLYLLPTLNLRLRPKLFREMEPGEHVVSHAFDMGRWKADTTFTAGSGAVFHWIIPANVGGEWTVTAPGGLQYTVELRQQFQKLEGTARRDGREVPVRLAQVRGKRITLELADRDGPVLLQGTVEGDRMSGKSAGGSWKADREGEAPPLGQETED
jgi:SAM-dependent methyltransferase